MDTKLCKDCGLGPDRVDFAPKSRVCRGCTTLRAKRRTVERRAMLLAYIASLPPRPPAKPKPEKRTVRRQPGCLGCRTTDAEAFYPYNKSYCKACMSLRTATWRKKNRRRVKFLAERRKKLLEIFRPKPTPPPMAIPGVPATFKRNGYAPKCIASNGAIFREATGRKRAIRNYHIMQHRLRYPERFKARCAAQSALHSGRLVRQPCEVPGCTDRSEMHHDDYSKPLEVRWVCKRHHEDIHHPTHAKAG